MKIVYCLKSTFNSGGMERIVISKANHFAKLGNKVWIITTDQRGAVPFFKIDPSIKCPDLNINYDEIENIGLVKKIFFQRRKLKLHKERLIIFLNEINPDIVISTFGNEISFLHKIKTKAKKIAEIHFSRFYRLQLKQNKIRKLINYWLTVQFKKNVNKYDAFVCLTHEDSINWKGVKNLYVIPNFIEKKIIPRASLNNKIVIAVGRLNYQKGYDRLIIAWETVSKKHPDWHLEIYGSGELEKELRNLIRTKGLDSYISINKPVNDIFSKLQAASAYVLSSHYEGLPMVLLESMACGLPMVSFDCQCGPIDLLEKSNAGILVPNNNTGELANSLLRLIENDGLREIMGKNAYMEADKYLFHTIIEKWIHLFEEITK